MKKSCLNTMTWKMILTLAFTKVQTRLKIDGNANVQPVISDHLVNDLFVKIILAIMVELVLNFLAVDIYVYVHLESMDIIVNIVSYANTFLKNKIQI